MKKLVLWTFYKEWYTIFDLWNIIFSLSLLDSGLYLITAVYWFAASLLSALIKLEIRSRIAKDSDAL